jgi:organic radical activating enzyme
MPSGALRPCCEFQSDSEWNAKFNISNITLDEYFSSQQLTELETTFSLGDFPDACRSCKINESGPGQFSHRVFNENLSPNDFLLELRFSNLCNYRCYTCGPTSSSKIEKDFTTIGIPFQKIEHRWEEAHIEKVSALISAATHISLLGGEPLYNKTAKNLIPSLTNKKSLSITTNGSVFLDSLATLDNLILSISIDSLYGINDYVRNGSDCETVIATVHKSLESKIQTHVVTTVSIFNIFSLFDTIVYFSKLPIHHHHLNIVHQPDFMSLAVLHPELTQLAIDEIDKCLSLPITDFMSSTLTTIKNMISTQYSETKWNQFIERVSDLDSVRNVLITDYIPQLIPYFTTDLTK